MFTTMFTAKARAVQADERCGPSRHAAPAEIVATRDCRVEREDDHRDDERNR
jgi:hypothetical protein